MRILLLSLAFLLFVVACDGPTPSDGGPNDGGPSDGGPNDAGPVFPSSIGPEERPAGLFVPPSYDGSPRAVVFLLHDYAATAALQDAYLGLTRAVQSEGFFVVLPDGTEDQGGNRFWNATPACCNFGNSTVDDAGYLIALLDELGSLVAIDPGRVFFMGHGNGGFMSYRLACEHSDRIAAIASLGGSDFATETDCVPSQPVSVLQIHGTVDATFSYDGDPQGAFPPAPEVVARWADRAGCTAGGTAGAPLDLDSTIEGAETATLVYESGCDVGSALWTMEGSGHVPPLVSDFTPLVFVWLQAHAR